MGTATIYQPTLPLGIAGKFPSTRYQGSKAKLANWIWEQVAGPRFSLPAWMPSAAPAPLAIV